MFHFLVIVRLVGDGNYTDVDQQQWGGTFHNKAAPGLKFMLSLWPVSRNRSYTADVMEKTNTINWMSAVYSSTYVYQWNYCIYSYMQKLQSMYQLLTAILHKPNNGKLWDINIENRITYICLSAIDSYPIPLFNDVWSNNVSSKINHHGICLELVVFL